MRKKFKRGITSRKRKIGKEIKEVFRGVIKFYKWQKIFVGLLIVLSALLGILYTVYDLDFTIARATVKSEVNATPSPTVSPTPAPTEEPKPRYKTVIEEKLIAKHTITCYGSSRNRNHNLANLARMINQYTGGKKGYVLLPGEKFDYFQIVGGQTKKKDGFLEAGMIIDEKPSSGIGGGVCQVTTTICSSVWKTKMKKGKKYLHAEKHSVKSTYIKPKRGDREATVAFASKKNFWFVNTLENPIRLYIKAKGGKTTAEIYERIEKRIEV